ncbi:MAG: DUF1028 domain-containing protein [Myxococcota bacterium]
MYRSALVASLVLITATSEAHATFSIAACDGESGRCGVAVATHNLAVGSSVPFARARVGAGVSQFETNPMHGPTILEALARGETAEAALALALKTDARFSDGNERGDRQVGVASFAKGAAAFTGENAGAYAGHKANGRVSVQGNGLASAQVLEAMWKRFHRSEGVLEERLLSALEAGFAAGGQKIGVLSAALMVSTPNGWPVDVDLRVDYAPGDAIGRLRTALNASLARQRLFRARRLASQGQSKRAGELAREALRLAPTWDRVWLGAAGIAREIGDSSAARMRGCRFAELNPVWAGLMEEDFSGCR